MTKAEPGTPRFARDPTGLHPRLRLPLHSAVEFVLCNPHYPENVGAAARALKTMGFDRLTLVKHGRLAHPKHDMAQKMAVKSWDVLDAAHLPESLNQVLDRSDLVVATTAKRGQSGILTLRQAAARVVSAANRAQRICIVFGNEKTGLRDDDLQAAHVRLRIPMAAAQPSINLAQAVQLVSYELFVCALEDRHRYG